MGANAKVMNKNLPVQSIELAVAVPQVLARRLLRLSAMGLQPSLEDFGELNHMWLEKVVAFGESWTGIVLETARFQQKILESAAAYWLTPWLMPHALVETSLKHVPEAGERIARKGLAPIHGRAVANAKRLSRAGSR